MEVHVFCPEDTPEVNVSEIGCRVRVYRVNGLIDDCGKLVATAGEGLVRRLHAQGAVPPRGQEDDGPGAGRAARLAPARRDPLPDRRRHRPDRHVEGVRRTRSLGWIGDKRPRMVACRRGLRADRPGIRGRQRQPFPNAHTIAAGIRVPAAVGDYLILDAVRGGKGFAIAVTDEKISAALSEVAREEGLLLCPEGAATYAAYRQEASPRAA